MIEPTFREEHYPADYGNDGSLVANLRFAFRNEPLDLAVVWAALQALGSTEVERWVQREPTGEYARRAWFLYEFLGNSEVDLPPARDGRYAAVLDDRRHYTAPAVRSRRHRLWNNLWGDHRLCPVLRRTEHLEQRTREHWSARALALTTAHDPSTLARAVHYLYTHETRSSYAIEGEAPSEHRIERFVQALQRLQSDHWEPRDPAALIAMQNQIVESRYAATGWRTFQSFVGGLGNDQRMRLYYLCPRPEDVPELMQGWADLSASLLAADLDPVLAAAMQSFAFVFIHPFEDGNGRLHRCLMHHMLAQRGFTPEGVIFPISAAILRQRRLYDQALDTFSARVRGAARWQWAADGTVQVIDDTLDLYRFWDATPQAEYLYDRVVETIEVDLQQELNFLVRFDAAYAAVIAVVDMPNRRAELMTQLLLQNEGHLSKGKRGHFAELTDAEVAAMEAGVQAVLAHTTDLTVPRP
ncbi:MAG: Fic family protein [Fimbriimonadaceae bacterium]|nr:Fic family protein [Fimbriimonadaceae bacterium]